MATKTTVRVVPEGTRERILGAALAVFAERGFDGARTREIAERAGANLGLIKYYFDDKERLWKAAVARAFEELQQEFAEPDVAPVEEPDGRRRTRNGGRRRRAAVGEGDVRAGLERAVRRFVRFVARRPEFMRLMNDEAKRDGPRMRWLADRFVGPMTAALDAQVARAQAAGLVAPISPVSLRYIVLGAAGLVFSQAPECRYLTGVDPTDPAFAERHADAVVALLRAMEPRHA